MAEQGQSSGFTLPLPGGASNPSGSGLNVQLGGGGVTIGVAPSSNTQTRDIAIGVGVLLVLMVVFFFVKNGYANWLVGRRVSPRSANAAGWWLFLFLVALAVGGIFPLVSQASFLSIPFLAPVGVLGIASLVMLLVSSRR